MPFIVPFIPLIAAGVGAAGVGLSIDQMINQPGTPGPSASDQAQTDAQKKIAQQKAAFLSSQAANQNSPNGLSTPAGSNPADIASMLKLLSPGGTPGAGGVNISGGIDGASTPPPQVTNGLTNLAV